MKKKDLYDLLSLLALPILLMVLGLILLLRPFAASAFLSRLLGWCVFAAGIGCGVSGIVRHNGRRILAAIVCLGFGSWLIGNSMALSAMIGRIAGVLLLIQGLRDIGVNGARPLKTRELLLAAGGVILILLPQTTSWLLYSACGLALLVIGALMLYDRLHTRRLGPGDDNDPNIIDAL